MKSQKFERRKGGGRWRGGGGGALLASGGRLTVGLPLGGMAVGAALLAGMVF